VVNNPFWTSDNNFATFHYLHRSIAFLALPNELREIWVNLGDRLPTIDISTADVIRNVKHRQIRRPRVASGCSDVQGENRNLAVHLQKVDSKSEMRSIFKPTIIVEINNVTSRAQLEASIPSCKQARVPR
jgi:hypothetical protein